MLAAVCKVTSVNGFRTGWQGIPIYLALVSICGRIANCKVILREDALMVVNPLRSHFLPKNAIRDVSVSDDGTLEVHLEEGRAVSVFAFGGSLADHFRGSSGEAERKISKWLHYARAVSESEAAAPQVRWTRCRSADVSLILGVAISGAGAIWMALSGG
ncbi:PH domain-containing protein (plasmid) [Streptomyces sp. NBC_01527]|uniref:PH domain-containing protein n=1 Tax=Streptomyces sp. NBC_01527 TaxID=2903894 RepID=UPI002F90867C